jgi:hypothetical protein
LYFFGSAQSRLFKETPNREFQNIRREHVILIAARKKAAASSEFTSLEGSGLEYPKYLWD